MTSIYTKIDKDTKSKILALFNKTLDDLSEDVKIIKTWLNSQKGLPEFPSDAMIEYFLVNNKFSFENTKQKLYNYYSCRNLIYDNLGSTNPKQDWVKKGYESQYLFMLPKLVDDIYRICFIKYKDISSEEYKPEATMAAAFNMAEVRMQEDFMFGDITVVDFQHGKLAHFLKVTPSHVKLCVANLEKVYSNRVKEIHVINHPPALDLLLRTIKIFMKPKMYNKIHLHDSIESLYTFVPQEVLPRDYGGHEMSLDELEEQWNLKLEEYSSRFDLLEKFKTDDLIKQNTLKIDDDFGIEGTFRKLNVD